jgi:hypothetical protein
MAVVLDMMAQVGGSPVSSYQVSAGGAYAAFGSPVGLCGRPVLPLRRVGRS